MNQTAHPTRPNRHEWAGYAGCVLAGLGLLWGTSYEPAARNERPDSAPMARFVELTAAAGIDFVHRNGAAGEKLLPESMGAGVAFFDFDNDGAPDLLFINSTDWPWTTNSAGSASQTMGLYRNDGAGRFANVTPGSGLDVAFYGMGVACGDFDNDGWVDVFITGVGQHRLFKNLGGGRFADVTRLSGIQSQSNQWSTSSAWLDYDNDGRLDLFVAHYVEWSAEADRAASFTYDGRVRAYGPPKLFRGAFPQLYHNEGNGRFTDVSAAAGLRVTDAGGQPLAKTLGVAPVDLDGDGWIDVVAANDTVQNLVFRNERNGTFREIGARSGVAFDSLGGARGAMGIDTARFREDDALGIAIGNFANEMNSLYVTQNDPLHFADEAIGAGLGPASQQLLKFGLFFFDFDLDGRLDVLTANGHLDPDIALFLPQQQYRQSAQLFWNRGGRAVQFMAVTPETAGPDLFRPIVGRGSAHADIDGDGDLDVVLTQVGGPPLLLRNDLSLSSGHHWIRIRLKGIVSNHDAIGAWVKLRVGGRILARQVMPTKGYLSQSELVLTFGLGKHHRVDEAEVIWPGGRKQPLTGLRIDAVNLVSERP